METVSVIKTSILVRGRTGSVDDVPVAFHHQPNQGRRSSLFIGNTLEVLIRHTSCGAGPAREVEATAARDDLQIVFVQRTCAEPSQGVPHGFAQELDSIARQKDMDLMPSLNRCGRDEKGECRLGRALRATGDMDKEAGHEHLT